jgi:hypothetical protein
MCRTHLNPTLPKVCGEGTLFLWLKANLRRLHPFVSRGGLCSAGGGALIRVVTCEIMRLFLKQALRRLPPILQGGQVL